MFSLCDRNIPRTALWSGTLIFDNPLKETDFSQFFEGDLPVLFPPEYMTVLELSLFLHLISNL